MTIRNLDALLDPRCVAVVGASDRPGSLGSIVWRNLLAGGFGGTLLPVNPRHRELDGIGVAHRCKDLASVPDLALVCTPRETLGAVIGELAKIGTRAAIILTAGVDAAALQSLRETARPRTMRLLGPGSLGILSPHQRLNASAAHADATAGDVAFVSQSAGLLATMLDWGRQRHLGFSHLISTGARMDVDFGDLLDYLASDVSTRSILLYVETIESPRKFMSAARAAARNKPVIVVKAPSSRRAIDIVPTGLDELADEDLVFDAAIRRAGMLRVDTLQELFIAARTLARFDADMAHGLTILTNSGGAGALAKAAASRMDLPLRKPSDSLRRRLDSMAPGQPSGDNPIDLGDDATTDRHVGALEALLADADTGAILLMHAPTAAVDSTDVARACLPLAGPSRRRILSCWLGAGEARELFEAAGIVDLGTPDEAVRAAAMLATYRRNQALLLQAPPAHAHEVVDRAGARAIVATVLAQGRESLDASESRRLLAAYGIPMTPVPLAHAGADVGSPKAHALVAGALIDPVFGPVLVFGRGGTLPGAMPGRAVALPPLNRVLAREMVSRTRLESLLEGRDGHPPMDIDAVCDTLIALSQMQADLPELAELVIDPLWADGECAWAEGARVRLSRTAVAGADRFAIRPYPDDLTERIDWQGRTVTIRAIRPEDEALHRAFIAHVDPADLRLRFFSSRRELPRSELARLVQIDYAREMAFIALDTAADGAQETLGVVRAVSDPDDVEAEFAILVRTDVQGRRLGSVLLTKMIDYVRRRGLRRMTGYVLRENASMHALVLSLGFRADSHTREPGAIYYTLELQPEAKNIASAAAG